MTNDDDKDKFVDADAGATAAAVAGGNPTAPAVHGVMLKLPPFWPADPELWIAQVEAQFRTRGITQDSTKYDHVVGSLSPDTAMEIREVLLRPPEEHKYDALKAALLRRHELSDQRRLQELLSQEDLGDKKPTQVLRRMQQLVGDHVIDTQLLRSLFIQKLPNVIQPIMVTAGAEVRLTDLAEMADKMMEVTSFSTVSAVTTPVEHQLSSEVSSLRREVGDLKRLLQNITINSVGGGNSRPQRGNSRGRSPYRRQSRDSSKHPLCWYHHKFGEKSHRCEKPCAWQGNDLTGLQEK